MATTIDFYSDLDLHDGQLKNAKIEQLANVPENPETSRIYFNTTDSKLYLYNGIEWSFLGALSDSLMELLTGATVEGIPNTIALRDENGVLIDINITKALDDAAIAQATANSKKRTFSTTPTPPYDIGDLWTQGSSGDLMRCKTSVASGGTYSAAHWERAFKWDMARSIYDTNANGVVDNAEKVNGLSVQTAVPVGAIFTDTLTTINGKTGVIAKTDIVALGIPAQDTTYSLATQEDSGLISNTDKTKIDGVEVGANNYIHPNTHLPSIILQDENNRFVTDEQINVWTSKQDALGFSPENISNKGQINGYAELDSGGKVPESQLPVIPEGHTHLNKAVLDKITGGLEESYSLDSFVTDAELADLGAGDMLKSVYDTNGNGVVDNAEKVNGLTVETAVPSGAVFTDTVTTVNGNSGTILKVDIVALGIPAQDTTYENATASTDGLMKNTDKIKLDAITGTNTGDQTLNSYGITATSDEINVLDGITSTTVELNYVSGATSNIQSQMNEKASDTDLLSLELSKLSSYSTNIDANGIYVNVEWKRVDATTYAKSTLTGTTPNYNQITIDYYDDAGTTILHTVTWNITYDVNDFSYQRVVA